MKYESWCALSDHDLADRDIAEVNLAAAVGLPDFDPFSVPALRRKLDEWASLVREGTNHCLTRYRNEANYRDLTDAQFRMCILVTILQRNLRVSYNQEFIKGDYDARDSRNLFLHGVLTGHGGTCVTMPVLYAAIGRRLGYPIKLAFAKEHVFCRWDEPGERFNIEATSPGFSMRPDSYYLKWPFPITSDEIASHRYLVSLTPREELACFLIERGNCLRDRLKWHKAVEAFYWAAQLDDRHSGMHMVASIIFEINRQVPELDSLPSNGPISQLIDFIAPKVRIGTAWGMRIAKEELLRILRLHHRSLERALRPL